MTLKRARAQLGVKAAKSAGGWTVALPDPLDPLGASPVMAGFPTPDGGGDGPKGIKEVTSSRHDPLDPLDPLGIDQDGWTTPA
jgi:hypothetical protein